MSQRVNPALLALLKEALATTYWYKTDLRDFLSAATGDRALINSYRWDDRTVSKRDIVASLVNRLFEDQHLYRDTLIQLLLAAAEIPDPIALKSLEDGEPKYQAAVRSLEALRPIVAPYRTQMADKLERDRRREMEKQLNSIRQHTTETLRELNGEFAGMNQLAPQPRGYALEGIMNRLFNLYELEARAPFGLYGEQIDGAFTLDSTDYIFEAKWQAEKTPVVDLVQFASKVDRRIDNTLGLFLSMNGFQDSAADLLGRSGRHKTILMDGGDLAAILDNRIALPLLLQRKKRHAAETGEIYISAWVLLGS
ncbi:hypothetical protein [Arthrobacter cryoconiti]|uniref:Restriction endonuclease type IV Mrr domain-containing protein n=1 Tax=Arthrobacter cryoconiti TaxID=748907 RepID=A0ABV8R110_9MICC|nr:hypothetical protein [Arthrobacter cryoconiti]MCC9068568.1 hypothetical protein [Arthrobacter cryoconiti]